MRVVFSSSITAMSMQFETLFIETMNTTVLLLNM